MDAAELSGRGRIQLVGLDLGPFAESFLPEGWRKTVAGRADLGAGFEIERFRILKAEARGESPSLSVRRENGSAGLLNVTQLFLGKVPDLAHEGFAYNSLAIKGTLSDGKLKIGEAVLDGSSMNIVAQGEVDVRTGKLDIAALAFPLKTVDTILLRIPVVRYILGGSLISVAVKAEGDLDDPTVSFLPPSAVVKGLLGVVERVLKLPVRIFEGGVP